MSDSSNLNRLLEKIRPHEIYNLAAQSHVAVSFEVPEYTADADATGTLRILDAIKETGVQCRFYQASTSELYGKRGKPLKAKPRRFIRVHPMRWRNYTRIGSWLNYREAFGLHASTVFCSIMNHLGAGKFS